MNYSRNQTNARSIFAGIMMGLILVVGHVGAAQAQPPIPPKGIINRLIEIKYSTELYLSHALKKETGLTSNEIDSAFAIYNTIRWKVDGLVYQISTEMIVRNSPALVRRLDAWSYEEGEEYPVIKAKGSIKNYVASIKEIEQLYKEAVKPTIYPMNKRTLNLTTNVFYLLKDSYSIVKGLSDLKTRKVMALVELLDHARLMGTGEIVKMGK
jgi:hypothetical protein